MLNFGVETEVAAFFPSPAGVISDFDVVEDDAAWLALEDNVWVADDESTLCFPVALALPAVAAATAFPVFVLPVAFAFPSIGFSILHPLFLAFHELVLVKTHLFHESTHHSLHELDFLVAFFFVPLWLNTTILFPLLLSGFPGFFHLGPIRVLTFT